MALADSCASTSVHGCLTTAWYETNQCPLCNICFPDCQICVGGQNANEELSTSSSFPFQLPAAYRGVECVALLLSLTAPFQVKDVSQSRKAEEK